VEIRNWNPKQERTKEEEYLLKRLKRNKLALLGESHLRTAVHEHLVHYHQERNHQGLGGQIILPAANHNQPPGPIVCRERLGELLASITARRPETPRSSFRTSRPASELPGTTDMACNQQE
jgi:hypothetical protein